MMITYEDMLIARTMDSTSIVALLLVRRELGGGPFAIIGADDPSTNFAALRDAGTIRLIATVGERKCSYLALRPPDLKWVERHHHPAVYVDSKAEVEVSLIHATGTELLGSFDPREIIACLSRHLGSNIAFDHPWQSWTQALIDQHGDVSDDDRRRLRTKLDELRDRGFPVSPKT